MLTRIFKGSQSRMTKRRLCRVTRVRAEKGERIRDEVVKWKGSLCEVVYPALREGKVPVVPYLTYF